MVGFFVNSPGAVDGGALVSMAFQIQSHGTRAGVKKFVSEFKLAAIPGAPAVPESDLKQLLAAQTFLLSEIDALPEEFNGARVNCDGNTNAGGRVLSLNVCGLKLHLE